MTGPSPPEATLIASALDTEFWAVKLVLSTRHWSWSSPAAESRASKATSEGELTRVGTLSVLKSGGPEVRSTSESLGKTR